MKHLIFALALLPAPALAIQPGLRVSVNGLKNSSKPQDSRAIRNKVANYVYRLEVVDFMLLSIGTGDDFSVCLTVSSEKRRDEIAKEVLAVPVDANTSVTAAPVEGCQREE